MKTFDGKEITKSWAVMDDNGEEYISAVTILMSAAGDLARAKRIARSNVKMIEDGDDFTIERRPV